LANDPESQLSHIYYANRRGLVDRIARIRGGKAPSAMPLRRTAHSFGNMMITEPGDDRLKCRTTWSTQVYDPHSKTTYQLFGYAAYELKRGTPGWLIARKKTVIQNDTLPSVIDVYCL
jgi:3-phenylpropionate/cinnamic acid dioxygenase small subunit